MAITFSIISFVAGLLFAFWTIRGLQKSLKEIVTALAKESETVTQRAEDLHRGAQAMAGANVQQASALQETAASLDEITAMVAKTRDNSKQLESTAHLSHQSATQGQDSISKMLTSVSSISESQQQIAHQVKQGNEKITSIVTMISEIENKTKVINDIVFQTKLLSFNASVEAARAGEHGKGFAVVAEEVGNLAQMSGNAAKEISTLLSDSISRVQAIVNENKSEIEGLITEGKNKLDIGSTVAIECGRSLTEIVKQAGEVGTTSTEITTAIAEQNQGIDEISKAMRVLDQSTHENAAASEQTSKTSTGLLEQAHTLHEIVQSIELMVNGKSGTTAQYHRSSKTTAPKTDEHKGFSAGNVVSISSKKTTDRSHLSVGKKIVGGEALPAENDPRFEQI